MSSLPLVACRQPSRLQARIQGTWQPGPQQPAACCQDTKSLCLPCRHLKEGRGDQACLLWEGNELNQSRKMTYKQVLEEVSRLVSCCAGASS